jgi:hypothetical protein
MIPMPCDGRSLAQFRWFIGPADRWSPQATRQTGLFYFSLVENRVPGCLPVNRRRVAADLRESRNFRDSLALFSTSAKVAVMGNGDIVVGKSPPGRPRKSVIVDNLPQPPAASASTEPGPSTKDGHCGAMSQQRGDSGAVSTPQKFVRLVGCHDVKARPPGTR